MSFNIFSDFKTTVKQKFKRNYALANITIAKFLAESFDIISSAKHSNIFSAFHTKSSRSNYIASELVLQYLEKRLMIITIQCSNKETRSKYFRKHSDKWLQRELQLKTRLDLFSILISDRKKKVLSTTVLKSSERYYSNINPKDQNINNTSIDGKTNNDFSSSFITPTPTTSPINVRSTEFPIKNNTNKNSLKSTKWPIDVSSNISTSDNSKNSPKSKNPKILNVTEISSKDQFYFQKRVIDEFDNAINRDKMNISDFETNSNPQRRTDSIESSYESGGEKLNRKINKGKDKKDTRDTKNKTKNPFYSSQNINDFEFETRSESESINEKYSVSESLNYRTVSSTDKNRVPRFQQLKKKKNQNLEQINKNSPPYKERQVTFVDQNQNPIIAAPDSSFKLISNGNKNCKINSKGLFSSDMKPGASSLLNHPQTKESTNSNKTNIFKQSQNSIDRNEFNKEFSLNDSINNQKNQEIDDNSNSKKHRSRDSKRRVRLSKNMPPKAKPIDDAEEYDIEFLREVMNEETRSSRKEKFEIFKKGKIDSKNDKFYFQESTYERDWDKIVYSESGSEFEDQKISNRFIKTKSSFQNANNNNNNDNIIDNESNNNNNENKYNDLQKNSLDDDNEYEYHNQSKSFNLSVDDNCFYFEREPTRNESNIDVGIEVNFDSLAHLQSSIQSNKIEEEEEFEVKPNYYSFTLTIFSAKNVVKTDLITTCDPYCKLIIKDSSSNNNSEEEDADVSIDDNVIVNVQTKIAADTQNPNWNEKIQFNIKNIHNKSISFLIFDNDIIGSDKMINSLTLPLSRFANSTEGIDEWLKMKSRIQVGTITDLHVFVKATPRYESSYDVDFNNANKIVIDSKPDLNDFNQIQDEGSFSRSNDDIELMNQNESDANSLILNEEESDEENNNFINLNSEEENETENKTNSNIENKTEVDSEIEDSAFSSILKNEDENENKISNFSDGKKEDANASDTQLLNEEEEIENSSGFNFFQNEEESETESQNIENGNGIDFEIEEESQNEIEPDSNLLNYENLTHYIKQVQSEKEEEENEDNVNSINIDVDV